MMYNKHKIIKLPGCFSGSMHSGDWPQIIEDSGNVRGSCYRQVKKKNTAKRYAKGESSRCRAVIV